MSTNNICSFEYPELLCRRGDSNLMSTSPTTYVFMENYRKLSFNFYQIPSSVSLLLEDLRGL